MNMIAMAVRMPNPEEHPRVLIYTEGYDFAGQQFFEVSANSLNKSCYEDPVDQPEECQLASHWMPLPYPTATLGQEDWKTEVLGTTLRVVEDTGEEFCDDVAVLGDCRDQKVRARGRLITVAPRMRDAIKMVLDADGDQGAIDFSLLREVFDCAEGGGRN